MTIKGIKGIDLLPVRCTPFTGDILALQSHKNTSTIGNGKENSSQFRRSTSMVMWHN